MFSKSLIGIAALVPLVTSLPNVPNVVARKPPSSTTPEISRPTNFQMQFSAFTDSSSCTGNNVVGIYPSGKCVDLPVTAQSWSSSANVSTQQLMMQLYSLPNCTGFGSVEHLDAGSACFSGGARSICIAC